MGYKQRKPLKTKKDCLVLFVLRAQYNTGCTNGEERSVFKHSAFSVAQNFVVYKRSCVARAIAQHVF